MGKSILTMHREIEKKKHAESPLGKLERWLGNFYDKMKLTKGELPEDISKKIYDIRDGNEKAVLDYVNARIDEDRKWVDESLLAAMSAEKTLIEEYLKTNKSAMSTQ